MERNGEKKMEKTRCTYALQNLISKQVLAARRTADISNKQLRSIEISDATFLIRTLITRERQRSKKQKQERPRISQEILLEIHEDDSECNIT